MIAQPIVEPTLEWASLTMDDLVDIAELCEACDYIDDPAQRITFEEIAAQLSAPGADLARHGVVGRDRVGTALAVGWLHGRGFSEGRPRMWLEWRVHPAMRHRQIGGAVVAWLRDRGRQWYDEVAPDRPRPPLWMGCYADQKLGLRRHQLERNDFVGEHIYRDMHVHFGDHDFADTPPTPPAGTRLVPFAPEWSPAVWQAHNQVFESSQKVALVEWEHSLVVATARPQWSWVALTAPDTTDEPPTVLGYAMSSAYEADWEPMGSSEGWIDRLGVLEQARGRGIGQALVLACLSSYQRAGLEGAGVGVDSDNPAGAERLFERLGFVQADAVVLYGQRFA
ncbi:GNAT family N-acetyltransferase [Aestuariimicrobium ganziense]|uniref:GNAT family N-acetyltransferase n=1 Tax=Aestuariimicrobium ganziense TaxID=2773677 RepID=UPI0019428DC4|nr:N-acetyltransferase [Aestuariimicrobium ganziense]